MVGMTLSSPLAGYLDTICPTSSLQFSSPNHWDREGRVKEKRSLVRVQEVDICGRWRSIKIFVGE